MKIDVSFTSIFKIVVIVALAMWLILGISFAVDFFSAPSLEAAILLFVLPVPAIILSVIAVFMFVMRLIMKY
jgi:hypothetical protein